MLNQKVSLTNKENNDCKDQIQELDTEIQVEELSRISVHDETGNLENDDLEKGYAKALLVLSEKVNHYKEVFQIDIQTDKG